MDSGAQIIQRGDLTAVGEQCLAVKGNHIAVKLRMVKAVNSDAADSGGVRAHDGERDV